MDPYITNVKSLLFFNDSYGSITDFYTAQVLDGL